MLLAATSKNEIDSDGPDATHPSPVYSTEAEAALLGAILVHNRVVDQLPPGFCPEVFYHPIHGEIFRHVRDVIADGKTADAVSVGDALKHLSISEHVTVPAYLLRLCLDVPAVISALNYASTILALARQRWRSLTDETWRRDLICTLATRAPKPLVANALCGLRAPGWRSRLAYDEFAMRTMIEARPPFDDATGDFKPRPWTPNDDVLATEFLQRQDLSCPVEHVQQAVETVAMEASYHPVRRYLRGVRWDRRRRLDSFAATYLGAEADDYGSAVGRCMMISAVARVFRPGVKADCMLVLEGAQGTGKSSAIAALAGSWFTDELADLGSKDAAMQLRGAWIIEISELGAMSRAEVNRVKAFLSRTTDRFRPPYGKRIIESPRQCVFVGTTNADAYLHDETGARRFWPLKTGMIDLDAIRRDRDQLWAEAVHLFERGDHWWLTAAESRVATVEQDHRYADDPWQIQIDEFLIGRSEVSTGEILRHALAIEIGRHTKTDEMRVAKCLRRAGWLRGRQRRIAGKHVRPYHRGPSAGDGGDGGDA